jgi:hypothetical protein
MIPRSPLTSRTIYYLGMFGGFALAAVVLVYKPDTRYVQSPSQLIALLPAPIPKTSTALSFIYLDTEQKLT